MRHSPKHAVTEEAVVRTLIEENPWATFVSHTDDGLVASHYPVILDDSTDELAILTHVGRPDEKVHHLGTTEVLMIVAGPHGYISPSWYSEEPAPVPTWNFSVAHCHGVPEILEEDENLRVLAKLVEHFEEAVERPVLLDPEVGRRMVRGTVGFRLPITRFVCKVKMSADKDPQSQRQVVDALRRPGPYRHDVLADEMERTLRARE